MNTIFENSVDAPRASGELGSVPYDNLKTANRATTYNDVVNQFPLFSDDQQYSPTAAWRGFGFDAHADARTSLQPDFDLEDLSRAFGVDANASSFAESSMLAVLDGSTFTELSTVTTAADAAMLDDSSADAEQSFHLPISSGLGWPSTTRAWTTALMEQHRDHDRTVSAVSNFEQPQPVPAVDAPMRFPSTPRRRPGGESSHPVTVAPGQLTEWIPQVVDESRPLCPRCRLDLTDPIVTRPPRGWTPSAPWESPASVVITSERAHDAVSDKENVDELAIVLRDGPPMQLANNDDSVAHLRSWVNSPIRTSSRIQHRLGTKTPMVDTCATALTIPAGGAPVSDHAFAHTPLTAAMPSTAPVAAVPANTSSSFDNFFPHPSVVELPPDVDPALFAPTYNGNPFGRDAAVAACYPAFAPPVPTYALPVMLVLPQPAIPMVGAPQYMWPVNSQDRSAHYQHQYNRFGY